MKAILDKLESDIILRKEKIETLLDILRSEKNFDHNTAELIAFWESELIEVNKQLSETVGLKDRNSKLGGSGSFIESLFGIKKSLPESAMVFPFLLGDDDKFKL